MKKQEERSESNRIKLRCPRGVRAYGPGAPHKNAVARLVAAGAHTARFCAAIRSLWLEVQGRRDRSDELEDGESYWPTDAHEFMAQTGRGGGGFHRNPDAYRIDRDLKVITAYEVVSMSVLTSDKLEDYHDLFFMLDEEEWTLDVIAVDDAGTMTRIDYLGLAINRRRIRDHKLPPWSAEFRRGLGERIGSRDPMFDLAPP